jgi:ubiquitin carboxyl-terminal hydrolase 5/13
MAPPPADPAAVASTVATLPTDGKERESKSQVKKSVPELQPGVPPSMFKKFIAKNHHEFSGPKQQDALEFIHYFFEQIQRAERNAGVDPSAAFNFTVEDRLECTQCHRVRYQSAKSTEISLGIPLVEVKNAAPPAADATPGKEPEIEYAPAPFSQCLDMWSAEQSMEGYACPQCNGRTRAVKRQRFESFPDVLMVQMRRFVFDNWVPSKVTADVVVEREIKLDDLRGRGLQPGEVEFPGAAAAGASAAPAKKANDDFVATIESMGLGRNLAIRAVTLLF